MNYITKKVVYFGDPASGKTCLLRSTFQNNFNLGYLSEWEYITAAKGKEIRLILWDTNRHYDRLFPLYFSGCDVIVLCFSIDEPDTLNNIEEFWIPLIRQNNLNVPIILVANKSDLRSNPATILELSDRSSRPVSFEDGHNMAEKIGACCYFECSAVTKANVQELVRKIAEIVAVEESQPYKKVKGGCRIS